MAINSAISVFVINLERDQARRTHMENMLTKCQINAEFISAVDGKTLSFEERQAYDEEKAMRVYGVAMLDNELGCYLSHYRIFERMVNEKLPYGLIFEDDIEISPTLPSIVNTLVEDSNPIWLVVRLHTMRPKIVAATSNKFKGKIIKTLPHGELIRLNTHTLGAGAYLISQAGAKRMLEYGRKIFMPIDQTIDRFWENGITPYIVRPFPARQLAEFDSRIGDRTGNRNKGETFKQYVSRRLQRLTDSIKKRVYIWFL